MDTRLESARAMQPERQPKLVTVGRHITVVGGRNRSGVTYIWSIICPIWTREAVVGARLNGKSRVMVRLRGPLTPLTRRCCRFPGPAQGSGRRGCRIQNYLSLTKRASVTADQKKGLLFKSMHRSNPLAAAGENDPTGELSRT